jgi:hypothetical protein
MKHYIIRPEGILVDIQFAQSFSKRTGDNQGFVESCGICPLRTCEKTGEFRTKDCSEINIPVSLKLVNKQYVWYSMSNMFSDYWKIIKWANPHSHR